MGSIQKLKQLLHWGPLFTLFIIGTISSTGFYCDLMWWPLYISGGVIHILVYFTWLTLILYMYFKAAFVGPGFVPHRWIPENKEHCRKLQFCKVCQGYKCPRAHHCRRCQRCVMKMDHHCPWINTCCGHMNHAYFTAFLFFAPIGCAHAAIILCCSLYRSLNANYYIWHNIPVPIVLLNLWTFLLVIFSIGLAIGVSISVSVLFYIQIKSILRNETGIETWIIIKAENRRLGVEEDFIYPYNLGRLKNLAEVFTWSGSPRSNGFTWTVRDGCDQFTFTREQIKQKEDKKERSVMYTIAESYNGAFIPIAKGCRVLCNTPCTDEPRLSIATGDKVMATRWKKHWLYGDKLKINHQNEEERGWFPRRCAIQLMEAKDFHNKFE